ncbi:MAG: hypothetical protein ACFFD2_27390, partial [Promethearchaeota archaeon]
MQVLELEPLEKKKLKLILVESEFSIDWWLEPPPQEERNLFHNLKFLSKDYIQLIEDLIRKYQPHFAGEERGIRTDDEFLYDNPLIEVFKRYEIPYNMIDISQNALDYIASTLEDNKSLLNKIRNEVLHFLSNEKETMDNIYLQKLIQWGEYLQEERLSEENKVRYEIREAWMLMGVLELARLEEGKNIMAMFMCDKDHFEGFTKLAAELGIDLEKIHLKKVFKNSGSKVMLNNFLSHSVLELMPIKVKEKKQKDKILYFFDTDEYASPFDINMAYDAGF